MASSFMRMKVASSSVLLYEFRSPAYRGAGRTPEVCPLFLNLLDLPLLLPGRLLFLPWSLAPGRPRAI